MSFYVLDDLMYSRQQAKENPNGRSKMPWCDAYDVHRVSGEGESCPLCGRPTTARSWERPRTVRLTNTRFPDRLHWYLFSSDLLYVSQRFKTLYEQEHLTGISEFERIETIKPPSRYKGETPIYYVAEVPYSQAITLDAEHSVIKGTKHDWPPCPFCWPLETSKDTVEKLVLHTENWTGADILRVYAVGLVFSQRFYNFAQDNQLTNFPLVPVEDYRRP